MIGNSRAVGWRIGDHGSMTAAALLPMLGLRVRQGPLVLRGITDDDLVALCTLAARGIHRSGEMPFAVPWTDVPAAELALNTAQYHWAGRASFSPEAWDLQLGVWLDGVLVGCQGFATRDYLVTRTGETGSWLGQEFQGQGIGTAMRQAMCALVFDHLDAVQITSGAWRDNPASRAVSRKVGYRENGVRRMQRRRGEMAEHVDYLLRPGDLVRSEHPLVAEEVQPFRESIGL